MKDKKKLDDGLSKAKSDALRLLSFRPRSVDELGRRLKLKRYPEEIISQVLSLLGKQGLLDDTRFAKLYAESRIYNHPTGRSQIAFDLKQKGVKKEVVDETLASLHDLDEKKMARDLVFKRFQKMTGLSVEKKKARIFGFLKRRGFTHDAIFDAMKELFKDVELE